MFSIAPISMKVVAFTCFALICNVRTANSADAAISGVSKHYWLDARLFSLQESESLDSYEPYTAGGAEATARLTLEAANAKRKFSVVIAPTKENGQFIAKLSVLPHASDERTQERSDELNLSNLTPRTIDLAKDEDGRVYRLTLVPRVIHRMEPKRFRSSDLKLDRWHFLESPVILNDQDYLGLLNMGSAPIAWVDIPGLAKIEFSLLPLKGAKPEGVLEDGTIRIMHNNETRLRITNVRNGLGSTTLPGGPYQVWVRWNKPSETIDDYRESMKLRIRDLRARSERGDIALPKQTLERLEHMAEVGRVLQVQSGLREVKDDEEVSKSDTTSR